MTVPDTIAHAVTKSRATQGLGPKVTDPATLHHLAVLFAPPGIDESGPSHGGRSVTASFSASDSDRPRQRTDRASHCT